MADFIKNITLLESAGIFSTLGLALKYVLDKAWEYWKTVRKDRKEEKLEVVEGVIKSSKKIFTLLNEITTRTSVSRALVLAAHDGGKIPSVFSPVYSTVLFEANDDLPTMTERWHKQRVDESYINIINKILEKDVFQIFVEDMDSGILRDLYKAEGIDHSTVYYLTYSTEKESVLYLVLNYRDGNGLTHKEKNIIRSCVTDITNILEDHRIMELNTIE